MGFNIGDKVRFLNEKGGGVIKEIRPSGWIIVESDDGFEYKHIAADLIAIPAKDQELLEDHVDDNFEIPHEPTPKPKPDKTKGNPRQPKKTAQEKEVDLHASEVEVVMRGVPKNQILDAQLDLFEEELREAMRNKLTKIIFIHGVGEGILREQIRKVLDLYPNISYHDASYQKYGFGATEVHIRYN